MKRLIRSPNTIVPTASQPSDSPSEELVDFDVEKLLAQGGAILSREIRNLMRSSSSGKLEPAEARDLVAYLKLLSEIKISQAKAYEDMSDEDLAKIAK